MIMALTQKEINARFRERRKQNGLCLKCGKPLDREGVHCISCRKILNEKQKLDREFYKSHGICPRCMKNPIMGDETVCPECRVRATEITMKSMERLGKEHYNKQHSERERNEHHKRIELGICTRCGKRKSDYGYKTCGICREKLTNYKRIKHGKPNRSNRYKQGLCYFCDNPVKDRYKVCEKHYQLNVEKARSQKAKEARNKMIKEGILY